MTQATKIKNKKREFNTDFTDTNQILREYDKSLHTKKSDNSDETNPQKDKITKPTQEENRKCEQIYKN